MSTSLSNTTFAITSTPLPPLPLPGSDYLLDYWLYLGQGACNLVINLLLIVPILKHRALRMKKEYLVILGLASADAIAGLAYMIAGIFRCYTILTGHYNDMVPLWTCISNPFIILWSFSDTTQSFFLSLVSLDRLIMILFPLHYMSFGPKYGYFMISIGFTYGLSGGLYWFINSYIVAASSNAPLVGSCCWGSETLIYGHYYDYYNVMLPLMAGISIILYILVGVAYGVRMNKIVPKNGKVDDKKMKNQRKLTISLGISSALTFFLVVLGTILAFLDRVWWHTTFDLSTPLWILAQCNPTANFIVIISRQRDLRMGLFRIFKHMPPDISMWKKSQVTQSQVKVLMVSQKI